MRKSSTIELNGKRYDATSGTLLAQSSRLPGTNGLASRAAAVSHRGRAMDGFVRGSAGSASLAPVSKPAIPVAFKATISQPFNRVAPKQIVVHPPERPKTLMRSSVQKPSTSRNARAEG